MIENRQISITVIKSNLGKTPLSISPSKFVLRPYAARDDTTAFTKKDKRHC